MESKILIHRDHHGVERWNASLNGSHLCSLNLYATGHRDKFLAVLELSNKDNWEAVARAWYNSRCVSSTTHSPIFSLMAMQTKHSYAVLITAEDKEIEELNYDD